MSKATESKLNSLHAEVADAFVELVSHTEEEVIFDTDGEEQKTGKRVRTVTPAILAGAVKFLKDNAITSDIEVDENMSNLSDALSKKQKHSRLKNAENAAVDYEQ